MSRAARSGGRGASTTLLAGPVVSMAAYRAARNLPPVRRRVGEPAPAAVTQPKRRKRTVERPEPVTRFAEEWQQEVAEIHGMEDAAKALKGPEHKAERKALRDTAKSRLWKLYDRRDHILTELLENPSETVADTCLLLAATVRTLDDMTKPGFLDWVARDPAYAVTVKNDIYRAANAVARSVGFLHRHHGLEMDATGAERVHHHGRFK